MNDTPEPVSARAALSGDLRQTAGAPPLPALNKDVATITGPLSATRACAAPGADGSCCIHDVVDFRANRIPDACALVFNNQRLTYSQLNQLGNQLAYKLLACGIGPGAAVGISAERSLETVIGLLAILKSGGVCVPLDPDFPFERTAFMIRDAEVGCVLAAGPTLSDWSGLNVNLLSIAHCLHPVDESSRPLPSVSPDDLAYVIYTSGSEGRPKGVELIHRAIVRLLTDADYVELNETKVVMQLASLTFDGSIFDLWGALLNGATCILYPGRLPRIHTLDELLRKHQVTTAWLTSSLFNTIIDEKPAVLSGLQQLVVGGEALSVTHIVRAWSALSRVQIINGYGPTEATVFACTYPILCQPPGNARSIPIGRPIAGARAYILDADRQPAPLGEVGELCLGGSRLARGYRNRPELTAEKFLPDPFSDVPSARLYRTGDLARFLPDGNIEFVGRADHQVKIHGYRIELGEIEATLRLHPAIRDAAVVVLQQGRAKSLVLFFLPRNECEISPMQVVQFLKLRLPDFMVPENARAVKAFPLTPSGKVDRQALVQAASLARPGSKIVPPRNSTERRLVDIWESLLDQRPVGIRDNFFGCGGDSLLAISLLAAIEESFGKALTIESLLSAPTIEQLADAITFQDRSETLAYATPVQSDGALPPFFCIGAGPLLRPLSDALGRRRPFFGVGLEVAAFDRLSQPYSVEEIASHLVHAIQKQQPDGPYYLGGFCHDGLFAYEAAAQLDSKGFPVGLLALFETVNPSPTSADRMRTSLRRLGLRIHRPMHELSRVPASGLLAYARNRARQLRKSVQRAVWRVQSHLDFRLSESTVEALERVLYLAASSYRPRPLHCPSILFRAKDWPIASAGDNYLGWLGLLKGPHQSCVVPGDHSGILSKPNVSVLARQLEAAMEVGIPRDP